MHELFEVLSRRKMVLIRCFAALQLQLETEQSDSHQSNPTHFTVHSSLFVPFNCILALHCSKSPQFCS